MKVPVYQSQAQRSGKTGGSLLNTSANPSAVSAGARAFADTANTAFQLLNDFDQKNKQIKRQTALANANTRLIDANTKIDEEMAEEPLTEANGELRDLSEIRLNRINKEQSDIANGISDPLARTAFLNQSNQDIATAHRKYKSVILDREKKHHFAANLGEFEAKLQQRIFADDESEIAELDDYLNKWTNTQVSLGLMTPERALIHNQNWKSQLDVSVLNRKLLDFIENNDTEKALKEVEKLKKPENYENLTESQRTNFQTKFLTLHQQLDAKDQTEKSTFVLNNLHRQIDTATNIEQVETILQLALNPEKYRPMGLTDTHARAIVNAATTAIKTDSNNKKVLNNKKRKQENAKKTHLISEIKKAESLLNSGGDITEDVKNLDELLLDINFNLIDDDDPNIKGTLQTSIRDLSVRYSVSNETSKLSVPDHANLVARMQPEKKDTQLKADVVNDTTKSLEEKKKQLGTEPYNFALKAGVITGNTNVFAENGVEQRLLHHKIIENHYGISIPLFDTTEVENLEEQYSTANVNQQYEMIVALTEFGEKTPDALDEIAKNKPELAMLAGIHSMMGKGGRKIIRDALAGFAYLKDNPDRVGIELAERVKQFQEIVGEGDYAIKYRRAEIGTIQKIVEAVYFERLEDKAQPDTDLYENVVQELFGRTTRNGEEFGGIEEINGVKTLIPESMTADMMQENLENLESVFVKNSTGFELTENQIKKIRDGDLTLSFFERSADNELLYLVEQGRDNVMFDSNGKQILLSPQSINQLMTFDSQKKAMMNLQKDTVVPLDAIQNPFGQEIDVETTQENVIDIDKVTPVFNAVTELSLLQSRAVSSGTQSAVEAVSSGTQSAVEAVSSGTQSAVEIFDKAISGSKKAVSKVIDSISTDDENKQTENLPKPLYKRLAELNVRFRNEGIMNERERLKLIREVIDSNSALHKKLRKKDQTYDEFLTDVILKYKDEI